jgi:hypothetical protein
VKILLAAFSGSAVAALCALLTQWAFSGATRVPTIQTAALGVPELSIVLAMTAVLAGAFVATRIHDSVETLSAFATVQLFLGPALIRRLWMRGPGFAVIAFVLVITFTVIGGALGSRRRLARMLDAPTG